MSILLVAATPLETALLRERLGLRLTDAGHWTAPGLVLLHTGIGMVNTAWTLATYLATARPTLAIDLGIAGSYDPALALGEVVEVRSDCFAELGAETPGGFIDLQGMGFPLLEAGPHYNRLDSPWPAHTTCRGVAGITVNTVQGSAGGIARMAARWQPQIETMEGAAFFYAMLRTGTPFVALRGISNYVEPRDTSRWQIARAANAAQVAVIDLLADTVH
ncbi:MAG: hypothetical protein OHK0039_07290 [Bacteroidia bacterium]